MHFIMLWLDRTLIYNTTKYVFIHVYSLCRSLGCIISYLMLGTYGTLLHVCRNTTLPPTSAPK